METFVVCGFPGVGKTYATEKYAERGVRVLDLDSSGFDKAEFPANYLAAIQENIGKYDMIFVSTHKETRDALAEAGIPFALVYPMQDHKGVFMKRYIDRGSPQAFIDLMEAKWDDFIEEMKAEKRAFYYSTVAGRVPNVVGLLEKLRRTFDADIDHRKVKPLSIHERQKEDIIMPTEEKKEVWVLTAIRESDNEGFAIVIPEEAPAHTPDLYTELRSKYDAVALLEVANKLLERELLTTIDGENPGHHMVVLYESEDLIAVRFILEPSHLLQDDEITVFVQAERKQI